MDYSDFFQHLPIIGRFSVIFGLIVILPKIAERFRLPGVVGLIAGGILMGPDIMGLVNPDGATFKLFNELGKLLLMFFAGFEINLKDFMSARKKATAFGFLTFIVPMIIGTSVGMLLGFSLNGSVLIGSLMASHTLLGLPIIKDFGLIRNEAVIVTVGATIFTDIAAMLVLAICLSIHSTGFSPEHLGMTLGGLALYVPLVVFGLSWVAKKLFAITQSEELRLAILLLVVAVASLLAEVIEIEGIVGAFLAGIAVNRALGEHHKSGQTLSVVSHALFIPVFLLGTGFLVNTKIFFSTIINHADLVLLVVGGLILAKFLAAWIAGKWFKFQKDQSMLMWSLSLPQVAATLAATMVAYDAFNDKGERLLSETMLNGVVVLVVVTSVLGPILTRKFGARLEKETKPSLTKETATEETA
jgi:Kef-type K+ transport system membrane component KefB